jgi:hypothetical protein
MRRDVILDPVIGFFDFEAELCRCRFLISAHHLKSTKWICEAAA